MAGRGSRRFLSILLPNQVSCWCCQALSGLRKKSLSSSWSRFTPCASASCSLRMSSRKLGSNWTKYVGSLIASQKFLMASLPHLALNAVDVLPLVNRRFCLVAFTVGSCGWVAGCNYLCARCTSQASGSAQTFWRSPKQGCCSRRFTLQKLQFYWHILHHQVIDFIGYFYKINDR